MHLAPTSKFWNASTGYWTRTLRSRGIATLLAISSLSRDMWLAGCNDNQGCPILKSRPLRGLGCGFSLQLLGKVTAKASGPSWALIKWESRCCRRFPLRRLNAIPSSHSHQFTRTAPTELDETFKICLKDENKFQHLCTFLFQSAISLNESPRCS